jgi:two-component system, NtrC family, sensor kinase
MALEIKDLRRSSTGAGPDSGRQADRFQTLVSLEQLAVGIVHELNMPIQYVGDSVQFLKSAFEDLLSIHSQYQKALNALSGMPNQQGILEEVIRAEAAADLPFLQEQVPKAFERILEGIDTISGMVHAMQEFARPKLLDKAPADINKALLQILSLGRNEYKYVAQVKTELGELPPVVCHIGELNRVFLALVVNAASAIAAARGPSEELGQILIRTAREDGTVLIAIEHTARGKPEEDRSQLIQAFLANNQYGSSAVRALDMARTIIADDHSGMFTLERDAGHATTCLIRLPVDGRCRTRTEDPT